MGGSRIRPHGVMSSPDEGMGTECLSVARQCIVVYPSGRLELDRANWRFISSFYLFRASFHLSSVSRHYRVLSPIVFSRRDTVIM